MMLVTIDSEDLEAASNTSSRESPVTSDEKFLQIHKAINTSVHFLCPNFEWSTYASSQFLMWFTYSADDSKILKRIVLSPNMSIRIFFREKELVIPENPKTIRNIPGMEKVICFVSKMTPCKTEGKQRAKECIGYVLPKKQNDTGLLKERCVACRKWRNNLNPKLPVNRLGENNWSLRIKCSNPERKYHSLMRKVKTCLLEIKGLKEDAAKTKETIFLRDLNSNTANEREENEMKSDENDPLATENTFPNFYEESFWSFANSEKSKAVTQKTEKGKYDCQKHKEACNRGEAYVNKKGNLVRARKMGAGCDERCRFRCHERISIENRQKVFDYYWKLGNHPLQWNFLLKLVNTVEPKSQKSTVNSKKKWTRNYFLPAENKRIKVCKTMFLKTLDISDTIVETALTKLHKNDDMIHRRGKNSKINYKKLEALNLSIRDHLNMLPISEFRFLHERNKKQGSFRKVNIRNLYGLYKTWMEKERKGQPIAGEKRYRYIFKLEFKLKFKEEKVEIN